MTDGKDTGEQQARLKDATHEDYVWLYTALTKFIEDETTSARERAGRAGNGDVANYYDGQVSALGGVAGFARGMEKGIAEREERLQRIRGGVS